MKIGLVLPMSDDDGSGTPPWPAIRDLARQAEAGGADSVWVYDHLVFRLDGPASGIHEAWTLLSAVAAATERVELGTIVLATSFRNPALLAKMATTLDAISGGRLILGVGCGWHEPEYRRSGTRSIIEWAASRKLSRYWRPCSVREQLRSKALTIRRRTASSCRAGRGRGSPSSSRRKAPGCCA